jgi:hypothetical protein
MFAHLQNPDAKGFVSLANLSKALTQLGFKGAERHLDILNLLKLLPNQERAIHAIASSASTIN